MSSQTSNLENQLKVQSISDTQLIEDLQHDGTLFSFLTCVGWIFPLEFITFQYFHVMYSLLI